MLKFTPKVHPRIQAFLDHPDLLRNLSNSFKTPLNIIFPEVIPQNIQNFQQVLDKHQISGRIFFAHKCNKSTAVVKTCLNSNINIDVASENELKHALACGFTGEKIEATGPKNSAFILLCLRHDITFNVDNLEELESISILSREINKKTPTKILLRINNFQSTTREYVDQSSRFGITLPNLEKTFDIIQSNSAINLLGFSFHLDTKNLEEKAFALEQCIDLISNANSVGLNPTVINIGGGFKVNYLASKSEWLNSISKLKDSFLSQNDLAIRNYTFGMKIEHGKLKGQINAPDFYTDFPLAGDLDQLLSTRSAKYQNRTLGEVLSENLISLYIEPGKSLLDNSGINITKVNFTKKDANDNVLIGLNMKSSDLSINHQEFFVDPILIKHPKNQNQKPSSAFLVGNLCMENDFIFKRKIFFEQTPENDDLLIFINTAGYFMDFQASNTTMQDIAQKIIITKSNNFYLDENYDPILGEKYVI